MSPCGHLGVIIRKVQFLFLFLFSQCVHNAVHPMSSNTSESNPFAETEPNRPTVSLWMLMFSLIVFAAFSLLIMFAARVPAISNVVNDFFGVTQTAKPDKPDRSTHLFFLLFCYASPLLLALWVGLLHIFLTRFVFVPRRFETSKEPDSPFA